MAQISNWFGDVVSHPQVIAEAKSVDDIVAILKDPAKYPSPVRGIGSNHSTSRCGVAEGGTVIKMTGMNKILDIGPDTVTAQAGALYIDVAHELQKRKLQLYINTEIGTLSVGSAACAGTKDASMPGEFGQVNSYVSSIKMVLPSGELMEVTDSQPDLMRLVRSSYGLFGIVYEATLRIRPMQPLAVHHETFTLEDFVARLPELKARGESMMYYIFPFDNLITVEFRRYNPGAHGAPNHHIWPLRNYLWATSGPRACAQAERDIAIPEVRYNVINSLNGLLRFNLENLVKSDNSIPADQIIRYPAQSNDSRYTFSLWAFPEESYGKVLTEQFKFARDYFDAHGYRTNMLYVGYRIAKDQSNLLSYSYDGDVMTVDPVSTANPGWTEFLGAHNQLCSDQGGIPLWNQTPQLTRAQAQKALGQRLTQFAAARKTYDPGGRLLNDYFRDMLSEAGGAVV
jgi:FAD/FMN-containing dehydrogenase